MLRRGWLIGLLALVSLAGAGPRLDPPRPPRLARPPSVPAFSEARRFVDRAALVTRGLLPGDLAVRPTPQGPRRVLLLVYAGQPVAFAYLGPGPSLLSADEARLLGDLPDGPTVLSDADQAALTDSVARLSVSGLVQGLGPQVRTYLLSGGRPVAELHFDRRSGALLPDPGGPPKEPRRPTHP